MIEIRKAVAGIKTGYTDELYDHFMCVYEDLLTHDLHTDTALVQTLARIQQYDQTQKTSQRRQQLKSIIMITSFFAALSFSFLFIFQEPPSHFPVATEDYRISSEYGKRRHPISKEIKLHTGIDIVASSGTAVLASGAGEIIKAAYDELDGFFIEIRHDDHYSSRYHHLGKILVKEGDEVKAGDHIGEIGSSGLSTGPHLHYEVLKNGEKINPKPFLGV